MFHHWMTTDAEITAIHGEDSRLAEVSCLGCGVVAPEWQHGAPYFVSVDHGPLPLGCKGPIIERPHHMIVGFEGIECAHCMERITDDDAPDTFDWECIEV